MALSLPVELMDLIVGEVVQFTHSHWEDESLESYPTFRCCSLASRKMYEVSSPHLYKKVVVRNLEETALLATTLRSRSDLAGHVVAASINPHTEDPERDLPSILLDIRLPDLPKCQRLVIWPLIWGVRMGEPHLHLCIPLTEVMLWVSRCPNLSRLRVQNLDECMVNIKQIFDGDPEIDAISNNLRRPHHTPRTLQIYAPDISSVVHAEAAWHMYAKWCPSRLVLCGEGLWNEGRMAGMIALGDTLRVLHLRADYPDSFLRLIPTWFPNLEELEYQIPNPLVLSEPFRNLRYLDIRPADLETEDEIQDAFSSFLDALASNAFPRLQKLYVHGMTPFWTTVYDDHEVAPVMPIIRRLDIVAICTRRKPPIEVMVAEIDERDETESANGDIYDNPR